VHELIRNYTALTLVVWFNTHKVLEPVKCHSLQVLTTGNHCQHSWVIGGWVC